MKCSARLPRFGFLVCCAISATSDASVNIITQPNEYFFTSSVYYAEPGATNATITVGFRPGDPSWTGSVGFTTADDTAVAGQDYTAVSGTLWFSGPAWRTFSVPLKASTSPNDKTVRLTLVKTESNCFISLETATLIIRSAPTPTLAMTRTSNHIQLRWPAAYTNYVAECATKPVAGPEQWTSMTAPQQTNSQFVVEITADQPKQFFRLRRSQ